MKINKNVIESINMKLIEDYNKSIKEWNLKMHKLCIGFLIILNICLIFFMIFFQYQVNRLNSENKNKCNEILKEEKIKTEYNTKTNYMYINFLSNFDYGEKFSFIFDNLSQLNLLKDTLISIPTLNLKTREQIHPHIIFSSINVKKLDCEYLRDQLIYYDNIMILISTINQKKFGIFYSSPLLSKEITIIKDKSAFIYDFNNNKKYMIKNNAEYAINLPINGDILFNVGNGDFIIYSSSFNEGKSSKSNFPVNFESNGEINNPFTNDGNISIKYMEIYFFVFS